MKSTESTAFLKGLLEGLSGEIDRSTAQGKLFVAILDAVDTLAKENEELSKRISDLGEYVEEMDDDLSAVEEDLYGAEDDEEDDDDEEDAQYYEVTCPKCGEVVCFDDSLEGDELTCPACGEQLELEFECDGDCKACEREDCDAKDQ